MTCVVSGHVLWMTVSQKVDSHWEVWRNSICIQ